MKPIQAGDHAEIIEGALGTKGPNVGKKVRVVCLRGEHSEHGRIRKVEGEGLISEYGANADLSHMPPNGSAIPNGRNAASSLEFVALQLAHRRPGAWLKFGSAPTS